MVFARGFGEVLGPDGLLLGVGVPLARLGRAFLSFGLGPLGFGCLFVCRGACAFGLDGAASRLLSKLPRLFASMFVTSARGGASHEDNENQHHHDGGDDN